MTSPECTRARERSPDLVVGILDGAERAAVLEHVHRCTACQAHVSELTGVADALVHLAPELEPPAGFADRVAGAIGRPRRVRRRWALAIAAAVAAAAITSLAAVRLVDAGGELPRAVAPRIERNAMLGVDGTRVGEVVTAKGDATALSVMVDYAVDDGTYDVVLRSRGGSSVLGVMQIADGRGGWSGRVDDRAHHDASVDLIDRGGVPVCSASVGNV